MKKKAAVIFTGGTISMKTDEHFGGVVPKLSPNEILATVQDIYGFADIEPITFGRYPGPHITPEIMLQLADVVRSQLQRADIDGAVVTHGTDTLEETAYFLDLVISSPKPIVVTGSMRNSSEPDWDGPRNLREAVRLAVSDEMRNYGTVLCLSESINAASEASKTDANELNTFESLDFGPLGRISQGKILLHRRPLRRAYFPTRHLPEFVPILKCCAGMDVRLAKMSRESGANGIVVEAFGVGNVPPPLFYELVNCVKQNIPVVLVSRCPVGRLEKVYAYEGAGKHLHDAGIVFADFLNGQKARIKLLVMLGSGCTMEEIRSEFEWI